MGREKTPGPACAGSGSPLRTGGNALGSRSAREGILAVLPLLVLVLGLTVYPVGSAIVHSFTLWDGVTSRFTGLANYIEILRDPQFWRLLLNNLIFIASVPVQLFVALFIAVLLYEKTPGWSIYRALYFLPNILSPIVIGLIFRQAFMYDGPVNALLRSLGLSVITADWLSARWGALGVISLSVVWSNFGYGVIIILAGMGMISPSVLEAAEVDGASWWQRVFRVILPQLSRVIEFFTVTTVTWTFSGLFGFVFSITNGGPGYDTTPLEYMIYIRAFRIGNAMGSASALAVILLLITFGISRVQMAMSDRAAEGQE
jgi:ABC-type sugar transport system permease subunit